MKHKDVDSYIAKEEAWKRRILKDLRAAVHAGDPEISETIKWGSPYFEADGGVAWMFCATDWVHFSFRQGVLLDDSHGLFEPTDNKAMRTIKFSQDAEVPKDIISNLVGQAAENNRSGKKVRFASPRPGTQVFDLPKEHEDYLAENGLLNEYKARPYYQQKGWIQWIESAKQQDTIEKRKAKMLQELHDGTYMPPKKK